MEYYYIGSQCKPEAAVRVIFAEYNDVGYASRKPVPCYCPDLTSVRPWRKMPLYYPLLFSYIPIGPSYINYYASMAYRNQVS